jgi:hypothetical protein
MFKYYLDKLWFQKVKMVIIQSFSRVLIDQVSLFQFIFPFMFTTLLVYE